MSVLKQPKSLNGRCRCDANKGGSGAEGISEKHHKPVKQAGIGQPIKPYGKRLLSRDMPPTAILSFSTPVIRSIHMDYATGQEKIYHSTMSINYRHNQSFKNASVSVCTAAPD